MRLPTRRHSVSHRKIDFRNKCTLNQTRKRLAQVQNQEEGGGGGGYSSELMVLVRFEGGRDDLVYSNSRFWAVYTSRFALTRVPRRANCIYSPCGWDQGARWGHIWVGSGSSGIRRANKCLYCFADCVWGIFPELSSSTTCKTLLQ